MVDRNMIRLSIVGIVGLPASYGGFETLVENLVSYIGARRDDIYPTVYCSAAHYKGERPQVANARLRYLPWKANGWQSVVYDVHAIIMSCVRGSDVILVLGVSGCVILPFIRFFSNAKLVINIDGIEWRREKWGRFARFFLKISESIGVKFCDEVIADNQGVSDYVFKEYGRSAVLIEYGGDNAVKCENRQMMTPSSLDRIKNFDDYHLVLCRIEPENNIRVILEAYRELPEFNLVCVGNWHASPYGQRLKNIYRASQNVILLDPIYAPEQLYEIRSRASLYLHGHSAGGTNPALVEMMHFGIPIIAFDCNFNRYTTENRAVFFSNRRDIVEKVRVINSREGMGDDLREVAIRRYVWSIVAESYLDVLSTQKR